MPGRCLAFLLAAAIGCSTALYAGCGRGVNPVAWEHWVNQGEPYSIAVCDGSDPTERFEEKRLELQQYPLGTIQLMLLGGVAKAALEAGLNDEANSYANQALALAAEDRFKSAAPGTFEASAEGDAVFLGSLVLGRLALLSDDVEAAEKYLLLSGQIKEGQLTFWGPNMTLARELLRRNRTEAVLQFLGECSHFWRPDCHPKSDSWAAIIRSGKMPDLGANLLYY